MTADQLAVLERQYLERNLLEKDRLSEIEPFLFKVNAISVTVRDIHRICIGRER